MTAVVHSYAKSVSGKINPNALNTTATAIIAMARNTAQHIGLMRGIWIS